MRLAANTGCRLHLIEPLGFELEDKQLRRAGLDYREWAETSRYRSLDDFIKNKEFNNLYAFTTKATKTYSDAVFSPGDALMFGPESRGLPAEILNVVYEAWRQQGFG
jgi:tRNA (cytidine/uridine-2'-O-)-methyltransferase